LTRGFGYCSLLQLGSETSFFLLGGGKAGRREGPRRGGEATGGLVDCLQVGLEGEEEGDVQGGEEEGGGGSCRTTTRRSSSSSSRSRSSSSSSRTGATEGGKEGRVNAVLEDILGGRSEHTPLLCLPGKPSSNIIFNQRMRDH